MRFFLIFAIDFSNDNILLLFLFLLPVTRNFLSQHKMNFANFAICLSQTMVAKSSTLLKINNHDNSLLTVINLFSAWYSNAYVDFQISICDD